MAPVRPGSSTRTSKTPAPVPYICLRCEKGDPCLVTLDRFQSNRGPIVQLTLHQSKKVILSNAEVATLRLHSKFFFRAISLKDMESIVPGPIGTGTLTVPSPPGSAVPVSPLPVPAPAHKPPMKPKRPPGRPRNPGPIRLERYVEILPRPPQDEDNQPSPQDYYKSPITHIDVKMLSITLEAVDLDQFSHFHNYVRSNTYHPHTGSNPLGRDTIRQNISAWILGAQFGCDDYAHAALRSLHASFADLVQTRHSGAGLWNSVSIGPYDWQ